MSEQKHFVTKVVDVDGAVAVDIPADLFKKLDLREGDNLLWTLNDDGSVTFARIHWS